MNHLSEEELIAHFYGEDANRAATRQHLDGCAECSIAFAEIESDLGVLKAVEAPARDEAYGRAVWASIAGSLPVYEVQKRSWLHGRLLPVLSYAAVCALLVAGAFVAGRQWEHARQPKTTEIKTPAPVQEHVVLVVLNDHLDRSERLLVELKHADADSEEMVSPMRDEARSLLAANRICRQNAAEQDDPALATALEHLDHVLAELASQPGGLNAATITKLQNEMNADGLLFEVRVLRSRIAKHPKAGNRRSMGGTA
jgi:hypothetical protein